MAVNPGEPHKTIPGYSNNRHNSNRLLSNSSNPVSNRHNRTITSEDGRRLPLLNRQI